MGEIIYHATILGAMLLLILRGCYLLYWIESGRVIIITFSPQELLALNSTRESRGGFNLIVWFTNFAKDSSRGHINIYAMSYSRCWPDAPVHCFVWGWEDGTAFFLDLDAYTSEQVPAIGPTRSLVIHH